jgi:hypothetical protein
LPAGPLPPPSLVAAAPSRPSAGFFENLFGLFGPR